VCPHGDASQSAAQAALPDGGGARRHLEQLVEAIESEQFFFGTDFPHPEFQRYHNTAAAILDRPGLAQEAKDNILGNNIARCLRLG
jgi:predicted TIM-barrel fold metal-dependent hydrolase